MKLKNLRIVAELQVKQTTGEEAFRSYSIAMTNRDWFNIRRLGGKQYLNFYRAESLPTFTIQIVGYDVPENPSYGLDRRRATALLRKFGLDTPTTIETLQVAAQTFRTYQLAKLIDDNEHRAIIALTPFHPEEPTYFSFGQGVGGGNLSQDFRRVEHLTSPENNSLGFTRYPIDYPNNRTRFMHYPLILGVKR